MTCTRSQNPAAMPRSWVIRRTLIPRSETRSSRRARMRAWVVTSSAVVGSSAISTSGSPLSAIAIMTRCRIPPENSCGYASIRDAGCAEPDLPEQLDRTRAGSGFGQRRVEPDRLDQLVPDPQDGIECRERVLVDHRHATAADPGQLALAHRRQLGVAPEGDRASGEHERVAQQAHQREGRDRLAAPRLAHERQPLASAEREADVVHELRRRSSRAKLDPEPIHGQGGRLRRVSGARPSRHRAPGEDCSDRARTLSSSMTSTIASAGNTT